MNTPKKISPDRLKDTFVEIRYESKLPFEVVIGSIFHSLDGSYFYTNRQTSKNQVGSLNISVGSSPLFYNDKIKVLLIENSLLFNSLSTYIGWEEYQKEIEKVISQILKKNSPINHFTRASVRYISEYEKTNITDCFKFSFTFGMPNVKSDVFTFRSEFIEDNLKIFLNLQSNVKVRNKEGDNISTVDIDVLNENLKCETIEEIMSEATKAHKKQKDIFFSIINDDFLKSLNPIY